MLIRGMRGLLAWSEGDLWKKEAGPKSEELEFTEIKPRPFTLIHKIYSQVLSVKLQYDQGHPLTAAQSLGRSLFTAPSKPVRSTFDLPKCNSEGFFW
jgi:hypothetical protein